MIRLKELREWRYLSQEDLAKLASVAPATIVRIEQGTVTPNPRTIRKLAAALGVEPDELVGDPEAYRVACQRRKATAPRKRSES